MNEGHPGGKIGGPPTGGGTGPAAGQAKAVMGPAGLILRGAECMERVTRRPGRFALRVLSGFRRNQGLLLTSAVAYNMLLSLVPLFLLLLVGLSRIVPEDRLLLEVKRDLMLLIPTMADILVNHVAEFLDNRPLIGVLGFIALGFFATIAFSVLEAAMSVIFYHRVAIHRRHYLISALIPFLFIGLIGLGMLLLTLIAGVLQTIEQADIQLFGLVWELQGTSGVLLYVLGVLGMALLLTALYLVMPHGPIAFHHALVGGLVAAGLWEVTRRGLVWYFQTLSLVNVVYGFLANAVVILLSFEAAALILLLGAQVIAELDRCATEGPEDEPPGFET